MELKKHTLGILIMLSLLLLGFGLPKNIQKKVDKEIEQVFEVVDFDMAPINFSKELIAKLPTKITPDNFYKLISNGQFLGYAYVNKASSKTAEFDYLVLFDKNLVVVHTKVLVYREEYGGEIGSKRWLQQFLGKTGKDRVSIESNIDAISGATISVRSMTMAMDGLLQTMGILQENNAFNGL